MRAQTITQIQPSTSSPSPASFSSSRSTFGNHHRKSSFINQSSLYRYKSTKNVNAWNAGSSFSSSSHSQSAQMMMMMMSNNSMVKSVTHGSSSTSSVSCRSSKKDTLGNCGGGGGTFLGAATSKRASKIARPMFGCTLMNTNNKQIRFTDHRSTWRVRNTNFPNGNSATEIEDCLLDEECKDQLVAGLEKSLDIDAVEKGNNNGSKKKDKKAKATTTTVVVAASAATTVNGKSPEGEKKIKRVFVNAKGYDGDECSIDEANCAVSEPPLNFGRLRSVGTIARSFEIWSFAFTFVIRRVSLGLKWTYKGGYTEEKRLARLERLAKWLRLGLLRLGPTFIKVGQQFSTRVDVLSPQFIKELEKLQDRVPPFPTEIARNILTEELGKPIDEVFDDFDDVALAAASLGQVHLCKLKTTGEQVIVKVQRPGLKEIFDIDLKNLRVIAKWLQSVDPKNDGAKRDWVAIFDETARVLYDEVDYTNEAQNATDFAKQFETQDWIKVPKIYWEYTSRRAMCMEYVPATKINDLAGLLAMNVDPDRMARLAVEAYLQQVLRYGFFHADPHPGNVAVDNKDPEGKGRLVVYDYGMMGRIPDETRAGLLDLFYATYEGSSKSATKALIRMGVLVDTGGDLTAVERTAGFFLEAFGKRINYQESKRAEDKEAFEKEFKEPRTKEEKQAVRKKILSNIGEDLMVVSKDQPFRFPAEFTFVVVRFSFLFSFLFSFSFSFIAVKKKSSRILCISETSRRC
jgi:predicted unusual protein kinase regulating ubiquinone biosynthesis (AarF/ABC1/UbiB family)